MTLVTTLSGESANSYVDVAYADVYWASHYSSTKSAAWGALNSVQRTMALAHACRSLEAIRFTIKMDVLLRGRYYDKAAGLVITVADTSNPVKATSTQALQFPRNLDTDSSGAYFIPEAVKNAQCEQALYLTTFDEDAAASRVQGLDYESVTAGQVSITQRFSGGASGAVSRMSPLALEMVYPYLVKSNKMMRG